MIRTCGTCKWGNFEMSHHAKPRPLDRAGYCKWAMPKPPALPLSITKSYGGDIVANKGRIWPNWKDCPVWEPKP